MSKPTLASGASFPREWDAECPVTAAPQRLGAYRLYLELASGGMASVHLAKAAGRTGNNRFVALKRVHPHLSTDPSFVEMFSDEARIASMIHHPNVCSVVDFDCVSGEYYLAMEFLVGEPISSVFRAMVLHSHDETRAPSRAALVARVIADACEGLHAAHELRDPAGAPLNVVHRDISPENLFLTYDGVVKIVDFGVARAAHQQHMTVPGVIKGKLAYMPPEVLRGATPDRRADVWAIGCVLWELLTGTRLFHRATDIDTLAKLTEGRVPAPSGVARDVPPDFDEIVAKALAWNPDARYATARELAKDLTLALARRGDAVGLAELAEWMEELFPGGAARKRRMLELAAAREDESDSETRFADVARPRAATIPPPPMADSSENPTTVRPSLSQCSPLPSFARSSEVFAGPPRTEPPVSPVVQSHATGSFHWMLHPGAVTVLVAALCAAAFYVGLVHARTESTSVSPVAVTAAPVPNVTVLPVTPAQEPRAQPPAEHRQSAVALPFAPGSYGVEIEPSRDEPGAFILRFRSSPAQSAPPQ